MPRTKLTDEEILQSQRRILRATAKLIAAQGYGALSMRTIAKEVNLTAGALYRYFPSKQDVLVAYWSGAIAELDQRFEQIAEAENDPVKAIAAFLLAYGRFGFEDHDRFRTLFLENDFGASSGFNGGPQTQMPYQTARRRVELCIEQGRFPGISVDTALQILWGCVHGLVTLVITVPELDYGNHDALLQAGINATIKGLQMSENASK